jgi:N-acetylglucosaminyldiphosphoundecaprenol N-acetyl-beta-D-mannosaminyltransferase
MKEIRIFNIKVHPLLKAEFLDIVLTNLKKGNQIVQSGINAASILELIHNEALIQAYNNSNLVNIDGMSVVWALRFLGIDVPERVACPDLADDILKIADKNNYRVFLFGAKEESVTLSARKVAKSYPGLILSGHRNGYYNSDEEQLIVKMINNVNPDILFLGLPSPKKEFFVEKYKNQLNARYILGVGGYFDILSGITKRAPNWIQSIGMEWFFRFLQEPRRMWRRYLIGNSKFIWLVLKEKIKGSQKHKIYVK